MFSTTIGTDVSLAAEFLMQNELVAIPTETVYGLAANATAEEAVKKVFAVKQRPASNPLIVHVHGAEEIERYVTALPQTARQLLAAFAPGPLTLLLPGNGRLPAIVNNGAALTAFRVPAHPFALALLRQLPFPLVAPSANVFTTISPTEPAHVLKNFNGKIPYILDGGPCTVGIESTVVGFDAGGSPVIYRQGAVTAEALEAVTGQAPYYHQGNTQLSPGTAALHYSPRTPLFLVEDTHVWPKGLEYNRTGFLGFAKPHALIPVKQQVILSPEADMEEATRGLYKGLHLLDEMKLAAIVAEKLPNIGLGRALNDRLQRAAAAHPDPNTLPT